MCNETRRTITSIEQIRTPEGIMQRTATHIVTEFHGYSTLCLEGNNIERNDNFQVVRNCKVIARNQLPITCISCYLIWLDTQGFTSNDFTESDESDFVMTDFKDICIS